MYGLQTACKQSMHLTVVSLQEHCSHLQHAVTIGGHPRHRKQSPHSSPSWTSGAACSS